VVVTNRSLFTVLCIVTLFCRAFATQNPNQANEQEQPLKLKAELVEIRAVVTDKNGKLIDNLSKEDFELFENDLPQLINFFSLENIGEKSSAAANKEKSLDPLAALSKAKPAPTRTVVLFIDTLHLSVSSAALVKKALRHFVDEQMTDQDLVCLVTSNSSLGLAEQFTQDRQILRYGIERIRPQGNVPSSRFTPYIASMALRGDPVSWNVAVQILLAEGLALPGGKCSSPDELDECNVRMHSSIVLNEAIVKRKSTLATLKYVTDRLAKLPGQRVINLFSDGFSLMQEAGAIDTNDLQTVVSHATRAGVVIYSIDAKGLTTADQTGDASFGRVPQSAEFSSALSMSRTDLQNGLNSLAHDTGGKFLFNTNDLSKSVEKVIEENRVYYSFAYYPNTEKDLNKFRRITIKVKGHPEYTVRTQKGYLPNDLFKPEKEEIAKTPEQKLFKAIAAPLPVTTLGIAASADYWESDTDKPQAIVQVYIDGDALDYKQQTGRYGLNLEVATAIYDQLGKVVSSTIDTVKGNLQTHRVAMAKQNGYRIVKKVALKPGTYQIRVGVREPSTEKIGTATAWVEVPDLQKNRFAMSGVFLSESAKAGEPGSAGKDPLASLNKASLSQDKEFYLSKIIQGVPIYKSGHLLAYYFLIYNGSPKSPLNADLQMQTEIVQGDKVLFTSDWQPVTGRLVKQDKKGLEVGGLVELNVKPGIYELRMTVRDAKSKKAIQQSSIIGVEP
jgi:VWFA-related protein